jgi:hypothetical protein
MGQDTKIRKGQNTKIRTAGQNRKIRMRQKHKNQNWAKHKKLEHVFYHSKYVLELKVGKNFRAYIRGEASTRGRMVL